MVEVSTERMEGVESAAGKEDKPELSPSVPTIDSAAAVARQKAEFYNTFWSLQTLFARPRTFIDPEALPKFKTTSENVLASLVEVTKKEQLLMGTAKSAIAGMKRKLAGSSTAVPITAADVAPGEYFFAKFLTSPDLLDFEVCALCPLHDVVHSLTYIYEHYVLLVGRSSIPTTNPLSNPHCAPLPANLDAKRCEEDNGLQVREPQSARHSQSSGRKMGSRLLRPGLESGSINDSGRRHLCGGASIDTGARQELGPVEDRRVWAHG